jgi:AcrR family transcriptional regulator
MEVVTQPPDTSDAPTPSAPAGLSGRRAQAARNDERILEAAREVFADDPEAPISAVAERAGVGISALYRRYASKEDLLRHLCAEGLARHLSAVEEALADTGDPWLAFVGFMRRAVEGESNSLVRRLAGTFEPTEELYREAARAQRLNERLFKRTQLAGAIRPDVKVNDIALVLEQLAAIQLGDRKRTTELRHRYLALALDALHTPSSTPLPGAPPTWQELAARWER